MSSTSFVNFLTYGVPYYSGRLGPSSVSKGNRMGARLETPHDKVDDRRKRTRHQAVPTIESPYAKKGCNLVDDSL